MQTAIVIINFRFNAIQSNMLKLIPSISHPTSEYQVMIKDLPYGKLQVSNSDNQFYVFIPDTSFNEPISPELNGLIEAKSYLIKFYCHIESLKKSHMNYEKS